MSQHEMQLLRLENERLQGAANLGSANSSSEERIYSPTHGSTKNYKSLHRPSSTNVLTTIGSLERTTSRGIITVFFDEDVVCLHL